MAAPFLDLDDALGLDPARFRLNGQEYEVRPDVSARLVLEMRQKGSDMTPELLLRFVDGMLTDESSDRLTAEWEADRIGMKQLTRLLGWLGEQVSPRPTSEATGS
jgi:hypothetical protein